MTGKTRVRPEGHSLQPDTELCQSENSPSTLFLC